MRTIIVIFSLILTAHSYGYDLVIANGRVIDPQTQLDAIRDIAIDNGKIVAISKKSLKADSVIDATGLVVAPGFIDLHAHGQDAVSNQFQAGDGVTTALELEIGVPDIPIFYQSRTGKAPINFGASIGHPWVRSLAMGLSAEEGISAKAHRKLSVQEHKNMLALISQGLAAGGLGIGLGITYTPAADHEEIFNVFELSAKTKRPIFVHMRNEKFVNNDLLAPLQEVLSNAVITGAPLHVVHINSSTGEQAKVALTMIRKLQRQGFDITSENYPYTAGSTRLESALFDHWTQDYSLLQWVATGERLNKESFEKYRKQGGWVIIHGRSEETNAWLVAQPDLIIASDGIPFVDGLSHPRSAGTFTKILGRYVRDENKLTLMQALKKMTIMPAQRLEKFVPGMKNKGRLQKGADADITIFNPDTVIDKATYSKPAQRAVGIEYVLVNGVEVISAGKLIENVFPGKAILAAAK